ncbi:hypothetical protein [Tomitella cavernea]|uniref:Gp28/Gp37-like domain-containing protein n=1 Tax=Tomitella cavernea TaxID=1387982 RepID=A0ABP9CFX9_9ACTN|nr:hypothetical protein [Tomitella cavernea]
MTAPAALAGFDEVEAYHDAWWDEIVAQAQAPAEVDIYDKDWRFLSTVDDAISGDFTDLYNDAGEGKLAQLAANPVAQWISENVTEAEDLHVRVTQSHTEWAGKAQTIEESMDSDGFESMNISFLHDLQHAKKIYCYPNPFFLLQVQWPKIYPYFGPSVTGVKTLLHLNLLRRYQPFWRLPADIFSKTAWAQDFEAANWPHIVNPRGTGLFNDTSMHCIIATRMGNFYDVVKAILEDAGLQLTATRWLPGDEQPFPEYATITMPTLIWDVVDKGGVRGKTGTLLDGFMPFVRSILGDNIQETKTPVPYEEPQEYSEDKWGTVKEVPAVVWYAAQRYTTATGTGQSGIVKWRKTQHKAIASAILTGGKSPGWVNTGVKLIANAILGYIGMIFLNPGLALGIFDEQIEDVILAFARADLTNLRDEMGRDAYGEYWESSGQNGFSPSTLAAFRTGQMAVQPYTSFQVEVVNGQPYWYGMHAVMGDRVSMELGMSGVLYTDQIRTARLTFGPNDPVGWTLAVGKDDDDTSPTARLARVLQAVSTIAQQIAVQS